MKYNPHNYQEYATNFIIENPISAIFLEMGLGKSVITLSAIFDLCLDYFDVGKVLVIAPLRVASSTWPSEIKKWEHLKGLTYSVAIGTETERLSALREKTDIYLINRENVDWLVNKSGISFDFDMIVIDELSSFKSYSAKRFKSLLSVRPKVKRIVGLTGTPSSNGLMDLWAEFRVLDLGTRLGRFISHYRNNYFVSDKRNGQIVFSYKPRDGAKEQIYHAISDITISMKSADYLNMPECVMNEIEVELSEKEKKIYDDLKDEMVVIEPEGAKVVKRIFYEYLDGSSLIEIARGLMRDEILTSAGKEKWRPETIKKILKNEKYIGDALLQKTYTVDFLTKKRVKNDGIVPQYYVENNHEPIIPRNLYMQVQEEMVRRSNIKSGEQGKKRIYSSKYALSTIVTCGHCGDIFRRVHWNNNGCKSIVWRCGSRLDNTGTECNARTIWEDDLKSAVVQAVNQVFASKSQFLDILNRNITVIINQADDTEIEVINQKLEQLQKELLKQATNNQDYSTIADEIYRLRDKKEEALSKNAGFASQKERMAEMTRFLKEQKDLPTEYDEKIVRRLIEKIEIFDENVRVIFKSGMKIEIDI